MFKKGDKVIVFLDYEYSGYHPTIKSGKKVYTLDSDFRSVGGNYWTFYEGGYAFECQIKHANQLSSKNMNIKERFLTSLKKEPEKSFNKAGITDADDMLTEDGKAVFFSWLLKKYGADFKKEVVDDILEEIEKEKK